MDRLLSANDRSDWRALLARVGQVDPSYLPEYHLTYSLRTKGSKPLLWHYTDGTEYFLYPFLLTPVMDSEYFDISSIYGYTGPIATTASPEFLRSAWSAFDHFAKEKKIIVEFIRFSPFNQTERFAHPHTSIEANRTLAVSYLPSSEEALSALLAPSARNKIRKAEKAGLTARELDLSENLLGFRQLYDETMNRNQAPEFFRYDDAYYEHLLMLGKDELRLFGVFDGRKLVAAALAMVYGKSAYYHLGASFFDYAKQGAGNLSLYTMSCCLMQTGVTFINMAGGRTLAADDPLLAYKKSNATATAVFHIGKRIVDHTAYKSIGEVWRKQNGLGPDAEKIIFWRS